MSATKNRLSETIEQLHQSNELLRALTDELSELLEEPADQATNRWVLAALDKMLVNLQQQFELEEDQGYLVDVLEQFPNWHPQVGHLRQQHTLLHRQLKEIRDRIAGASADVCVILESRRAVSDWIATYNEHQSRERQLIQDAFNFDAGEGE